MSLRISSALALCAAVAIGSASGAQSVLFDFNNAPLHTSLPIDLTVGGISAHFSATGQGFSIQDMSAPVAPLGFSGRFIYPNSVYQADLLIGFMPPVSAFSIQFAPQELACDDSATMRVTAYMGATFVGTQTAVASPPGTWPVGTLSCSFAQGFDNVVVHYDQRPTCTDIGPIFCADNMHVTPLVATWTDLGSGLGGVNGVPLLDGTGTLAPGSAGSVQLSNARPSAPAWLALSFASTPVPFRGGTLVPNPVAMHVRLTTDATGSVVLPFVTPLGLPPGTHLYMQAVVLDHAAVQGVALSHALRGLTP